MISSAGSDLKIESTQVETDLPAKWPAFEAMNGRRERRIIYAILKASEFVKLLDFPKHDGRNAPVRILGEHRL